MMDLRQSIAKLQQTVRMARSGARIFKNAGFSETFGARTVIALAQAARDARRGIKGGSAIIHLHALTDPLRPALVDGDVRLSYGELEERTNRLTHGLRALGVGPGERVGAFLFNGHEYLELSAALNVVGGQSVQIGYRLKAGEVAYILENSGARALLFHSELAPVVEEALTLAKNVSITRERCIAAGGAPGFRSYEELLASGEAARPATVAGGGYGGVMIYTSGTTGRAKGATRDFKRMGLEPVLDFISRFPLRRDERHLVVCPLYHSMAAAFVTMVSMVGGCNVIVRHFEPEEILRTIERERITSTTMVPTMMSRLVALPPEVRRKYDTSSLRWIMSGAAPLPTELARRVEDAFGPVLYNFYGATETGLVTIAMPGEHTARPGTIGRIIGGNEIRLLDGEGREVPVGEVGELYVRNAMLMDGYHANEEATRDATREGFISVGDLAFKDGDGYFYLADRKTDMVISGGVNIYPWEIEQRLHEHPAVQEAAVVGVPDAEWGESLAAFIVLRAGQAATDDELGAWVKETLADYKRPRRFQYVDALPRTPTGKVLKRELKQRVTAAQAASA
ncbi:MAG: AMP-dependent ligase [Myxococcales bacterium]|nr:AMP-dependent ligase [Myxococcales bacterium]